VIAQAQPAHDDMRTVFGRPEFDRSPSWFSRAVGAVSRFFDHLPFGAALKFIVWVALALFIAFILYRFVMWAPGALDRWRTRDRGDHRVDDVVDELGVREPAEWGAEGAAFEQIEDWKEAIRCRYAEIVTAMLRLRRAVDEPGRTTGELRGDVTRSTPECAVAFGELTEIFEVVWFADREATRENHARLVHLADDVRNALGIPLAVAAAAGVTAGASPFGAPS